MITLGLVDSVDDNGVYVTMPGSRGVLRGPYKALSTVAAGATVMVASTDDGEQVVVGAAPGGDGVVSVLSYGAVGDGTADDTEAIQAAFDSGASAVVFPAGFTFCISDAVDLPDAVTVFGYGATVKQLTKHKPCFDVVQKEDIILAGLHFLTTIERTYTGGGSVRYNDVSVQWCGIYASGRRLTVQDCRFDGFSCGMYFTKWDGTAHEGECDGFSVLNCTVDNVDFGILTHATDNLTVRGLYGSWSTQTDGGYQSHLFYSAVDGAGTGSSTNTVLTDIIGRNSTDGYAIQMKDTIGATISNVLTVGCSGALTMRDSSHLSITHVACIEDTVPGVGSIYFQEGLTDIFLSDVYVHAGAGQTSPGRVGTIQGERVSVTDAVCRTSWPVQSDNREWTVNDGDRISLTNFTSVNSTDYGYWVIGVNADCTNVNITNLTAVNCRGGVVYDSPASGVLDINVDRITNGSLITSPYKYLVNANVETTLSGDSFAHPGTKVGFYGATPQTKSTITGSRGGNAALASLLTALANLGLITDSTT